MLAPERRSHRIQSSDEYIRWSFFWFFLMLGFTFTSETKINNTNYMYWVIPDISLGLISTCIIMVTVHCCWGDVNGLLPHLRRGPIEWSFVVTPALIHFAWWFSAPFWPVSDGSTSAFMYFMMHPLESNIPVLWLIDGGITIFQVYYQVIHPLMGTPNLPRAAPEGLNQVQRSQELIRWSFFWCFVLFVVVFFDVDLHSNKGYVFWLKIELPVMFASTLLMNKAVIETDEMQRDAGGQHARLWATVSSAVVLVHLLWWVAGLFHRTEQTHQFAMVYALQNPTKSSIPFLWLVDGIFVIGQPYLQWRLVRALPPPLAAPLLQ